MRLQDGVTLKHLASLTGDWVVLFANEEITDYETARIISWAHVQVETKASGPQQGFGAIVSGDAVDSAGDVGEVLFAPLHPRFMGYMEPGKILTDRDIQRRLQAVRDRQKREG
jgi:hypothetical protein